MSNLALSAVLTFLSESFSVTGRRVSSVSVWASLQTSLCAYLCFRVSHWVVPHWSVVAQFAYKAVIHTVSLYKHSGWICLSPSIHISCTLHPWILLCLMHTNYLIGKADSQEDTPFSIAPFMSCCDSGIGSFDSLSQLFWQFVYFFCRILFFVCVIYS